MTLNWVLSAVMEAVCVIGCVTAYFVKPALFENLLSKLLGKLAFADVFTGITQNHIVDLSGSWLEGAEDSRHASAIAATLSRWTPEAQVEIWVEGQAIGSK